MKGSLLCGWETDQEPISLSIKMKRSILQLILLKVVRLKHLKMFEIGMRNLAETRPLTGSTEWYCVQVSNGMKQEMRIFNKRDQIFAIRRQAHHAHTLRMGLHLTQLWSLWAPPRHGPAPRIGKNCRRANVDDPIPRRERWKKPLSDFTLALLFSAPQVLCREFHMKQRDRLYRWLITIYVQKSRGHSANYVKSRKWWTLMFKSRTGVRSKRNHTGCFFPLPYLFTNWGYKLECGHYTCFSRANRKESLWIHGPRAKYNLFHLRFQMNILKTFPEHYEWTEFSVPTITVESRT